MSCRISARTLPKSESEEDDHFHDFDTNDDPDERQEFNSPSSSVLLQLPLPSFASLCTPSAPFPPPPPMDEDQPQRPPPPPPLLPPSTHSHTPKIKLAADPDDYDRTPAKFKQWFHQVQLYILANKITNNDQRIYLTLSYMKTGLAAAVADKCVESLLKGEDVPPWAMFITTLENMFLDKTITLKAREHLEEFRQAALPVDGFLLKLGVLFNEANLTDENEQIRLLKKATSQSIINTIYTSGNVLKTYEAYEERIITIG